jgi:hypothetical protein
LLKSQIVQIQINRPYDEAYRIVKVPKNFRLWSPVLEARFEPRGNNGRDWFVDLPTGPAILRFSAPNDYGVLDYTVIPEDGKPSRSTAARLIRNGEVSELVILFFQQPEQTEEAFASYVEWATTDFMTLKSVVETMID